jgi:hypothetical protein
MYVIRLALLLIARGRPYYLAPAYPMLLAVGIACCYQERSATVFGWVTSPYAPPLAHL